MCGSGSVFRIWIRIQEAPEYGSNMDPDLNPDTQHKEGVMFKKNYSYKPSFLKELELESELVRKILGTDNFQLSHFVICILNNLSNICTTTA